MFREAAPDDFEAVLGLYRQLQPTDPIVDDGSDRAAFDAILSTPGLHLFVLETDGLVVATTYLNVIPNMTRSASPYAVIENVVVDETVRGTGIGKQVMAATLEAAWTAGRARLMDEGVKTLPSSCQNASFWRLAPVPMSPGMTQIGVAGRGRLCM